MARNLPGTPRPCLRIGASFTNSSTFLGGGYKIGTVYYNIGLVVLEDKRSYCPLCDQDCSTVQAGANHCRTHEHKTNKRLHSYHLGHYCWTGEGSTWCCACALLLTAESVEQHARDARHVTNALHFGEAADKSINSRKTKVNFSFCVLRFSIFSPEPFC